MSIPSGSVPSVLSFKRDVAPMFRDKDRESMMKAFDLWSHKDVVSHQDAILAAVRAGRMPCDGAWSSEQVELLARWIEAGSLP